MNKILILIAALSLCSCGGNVTKKIAVTETRTDLHNAANSLDYMGSYKGTLPAADCPGIETLLTLSDDKTYTLDQSYLERNVSFSQKGHYSVNDNMLTLDAEGGKSYYKIEENRLRMLGPDMQPTTGELAEYYILTKIN